MILGGIGAFAGGGNRHPTYKRRLLGFVALFSGISTILLMAGAGVATRAYHSLLEVMNPSFDEYIVFELGRAAFAMLWLSVLLTLLASVFWIQSWRAEHKYKRLQGAGKQAEPRRGD